jgi:hypothetical protein
MSRLCWLSMLLAIHFDNQPNWKAAEIGEVRSEWKLPPKTVTMNRFASKTAPELSLRRRCFCAQFT